MRVLRRAVQYIDFAKSRVFSKMYGNICLQYNFTTVVRSRLLKAGKLGDIIVFWNVKMLLSVLYFWNVAVVSSDDLSIFISLTYADAAFVVHPVLR